MTLADLMQARAWLIAQHARAEGARSPQTLRAVRTLLEACDAMSAVLTPPPPVRVARLVPDTVLGGFEPTEFMETQLMEAA